MQVEINMFNADQGIENFNESSPCGDTGWVIWLIYPDPSPLAFDL